jgi:hypothetical protein
MRRVDAWRPLLGNDQPCSIRQSVYGAAVNDIVYRKKEAAHDMFAVCKG